MYLYFTEPDEIILFACYLKGHVTINYLLDIHAVRNVHNVFTMSFLPAVHSNSSCDAIHPKLKHSCVQSVVTCYDV